MGYLLCCTRVRQGWGWGTDWPHHRHCPAGPHRVPQDSHQPGALHTVPLSSVCVHVVQCKCACSCVCVCARACMLACVCGDMEVMKRNHTYIY